MIFIAYSKFILYSKDIIYKRFYLIYPSIINIKEDIDIYYIEKFINRRWLKRGIS